MPGAVEARRERQRRIHENWKRGIGASPVDGSDDFDPEDYVQRSRSVTTSASCRPTTPASYRRSDRVLRGAGAEQSGEAGHMAVPGRQRHAA